MSQMTSCSGSPSSVVDRSALSIGRRAQLPSLRVRFHELDSVAERVVDVGAFVALEWLVVDDFVAGGCDHQY